MRFRRDKSRDSGAFLWYASRSKLDALERGRPLGIDSVTGKLDVGVASAELGVGLDSGDEPKILDRVRKADRRLRASGGVMSIAEISAASPPAALFEFEGPCSRLFAEGAFWIAGRSGRVAILLVGSGKNATSGPPRGVDEKASKIMETASVDPVGSALKLSARLVRVRLTDRLLRRKLDDGSENEWWDQQPLQARLSMILDHRADLLARKGYTGDTTPRREEGSSDILDHLRHVRRIYPRVALGAERLWLHIVLQGLLDVEEGLASLPTGHGIAVYANRRHFEPRHDRHIMSEHLDLLSRLAPDLETIVIGSPIFVEGVRAQVQATP